MEFTTIILIVSLAFVYSMLFSDDRNPQDIILNVVVISIVATILLIIVKDLWIFHNMLQDYNINK